MTQSTSRRPLRKPKSDCKVIRTFTATQLDLLMLEAVAHYHGFSKSATLTSLVKREFWRIFPKGTDAVRTDPGARVSGEASP